MAEAEKTIIEKVVRTEEEGVALELSMPELRTVYSALLRMAGAPQGSPREHANNVMEVIEKAVGVNPNAAPLHVKDPWAWANPEYACLKSGHGLNAKTYAAVEAENAEA